MTTDADTPADDELIDGFTLDRLSEYLESGMTPADPAIDSSPACRLALDALRAVEDVTALVIAQEAAALPPPDPSWVRRIVDGIRLDVRTGRTIPLAYPDAGLVLTTTEAAIRGLIRVAGDATPGVLLGRCTLDGDLETEGAPLRIHVDAAVRWGHGIPATTALLRTAIADAVTAQTDLVVTAVDITVHDVYAGRSGSEAS